jgi:outer membrane lipoprotein-sorting protein
MRLLLVLLICLLAACAPIHAPKPAPAPPLTAGLARTLLERLAADARAFDSLKGLAKVRVTSSGRSFAASQVLLAEKPNHLRTEVLSPFGQPMLLMATNGIDLEVLEPSRGRFYRGKASPANLRRFTRLPLALTDLVHLLLYQVPLLGQRTGAVAAMPGGLYRLRLKGKGEQELFFDTALHLVRTAYYRGGKLELQVRYGKFTDGPHPFPHEIKLELPAQKASVSLSFSDVQTNMTMPEGRFALTPPAGITVLPLPR